MQIKTILLDDNLNHLNFLKELIDEIEDINLIQTFSNPITALDFLEINKIDLLFLDIEMNQMSGLDLIKQLTTPPLVVFVSSFPKYAIKSFEFEPLHYIIKPINELELVISIDRARNRLMKKNKAEDYIIISQGHSNFQKVNYKEILFIEADNDYIRIILENKEYRTHCTLKDIYNKLPKQFIKIHRSYIVNKNLTTSVSKYSIKINKYTIPVSRAYLKEIKRIFI